MPSSSLFLRSCATLFSTLALISSVFAAPQQLAARQATTPNYSYSLSKEFSGSSFFNDWNFYDGADPTHGFVTYGNRNYATNNGLIGFDGDYAVMSVDSTTNLGKGANYYKNNGDGSYRTTNGVGRKSVRIESNYQFTKGLIIADIKQIPTNVCGTWPAFWTLGQAAWPTDGEIDIIEGANLQSGNWMTLHTAGQSNINGNKDSYSAKIDTTDCQVRLDSGNPNYTGCKFVDSDAASYSQYTGGVWATQWTDDRIKIWFWPYGSVPADVTAGTPKPNSLWGAPRSSFAPPENVQISQNFRNNRVIFDTTFCGDLGDNTWTQCAGATKYASCADYVANNPSAFANAKWKVKYVKIYAEGAVVSTSTTTKSTTTSSTTSSSKSTTTTSPSTTTTTSKSTTTTSASTTTSTSASTTTTTSVSTTTTTSKSTTSTTSASTTTTTSASTTTTTSKSTTTSSASTTTTTSASTTTTTSKSTTTTSASTTTTTSASTTTTTSKSTTTTSASTTTTSSKSATTTSASTTTTTSASPPTTTPKAPSTTPSTTPKAPPTTTLGLLTTTPSTTSSTTPKEPSTTPKAPSTTPKAPSTTPSTTPKAPSTTPKEPSTTSKETSTTPKAPSTTPKEPSTTPKAPSTTPKGLSTSSTSTTTETWTYTSTKTTGKSKPSTTTHPYDDGNTEWSTFKPIPTTSSYDPAWKPVSTTTTKSVDPWAPISTNKPTISTTTKSADPWAPLSTSKPTTNRGGEFYQGGPDGDHDHPDKYITKTITSTYTVPCTTAPGYETKTTIYVTVVPEHEVSTTWAAGNYGPDGYKPVDSATTWSAVNNGGYYPANPAATWSSLPNKPVDPASMWSPVPNKPVDPASTWSAISSYPVISVTVVPAPVSPTTKTPVAGAETWATASVLAGTSVKTSPAASETDWRGVKVFKGAAPGQISASGSAVVMMVFAAIGAVLMV